jgi:ABC-type glycerol-3-phosphate transport system permease component
MRVLTNRALPVEARRGGLARLRRRWSAYLLRGCSLIAALVGAAVMLIPLAWLISSSLKPDDQLFAYPPVWIPRALKWGNYANAWGYAPFGAYLINTLTITAFTLAGTVVSCSLVAYGFARGQFPGRDALFALLLSTMMLPGIVTLIPLFLVFKSLGWINTFLPLIVPSYFASPFYVFLLRQFFMSLPPELDDAAYVDGASTLQVLTMIVLPLARPALEWIVRATDATGGAQTVNTFEQSFASGANDPFLAGLVASKIDGCWNLSTIQQYAPDFQFALAPEPFPTGGHKASMIGGYNWSIAKQSKHPQESYDYLSWFSMPNQAVAFAQATGNMPARRSALNSDYIQKNPNIKFFFDALGYGVPYSTGPWTQVMWDNVNVTAVQDATYKKKSPKDALDAAAKIVQTEVDKWKGK